MEFLVIMQNFGRNKLLEAVSKCFDKTLEPTEYYKTQKKTRLNRFFKVSFNLQLREKLLLF